jgi:enamine deaminase RidA (YjgF/YER057c/UK114 family)
MAHTLINPDDLHDAVSIGYSHVAVAPAPDLVLISGQYASDRTGRVPTADFAEQVELAFANLGRALAAAGLDHRHVVRIGTYVVDHDAAKLDALLTVVRRIWGQHPPAQTLLGVAALATPDMHFEVEAVAVRP